MIYLLAMEQGQGNVKVYLNDQKRTQAYEGAQTQLSRALFLKT